MNILRSESSHTALIINRGSSGYTLLELLVVLGIIAALTALVAPQVLRYVGDARSQAAKIQLQNIESALELYYLDTGQYPKTDAGLAALVAAPADAKAWSGPYLKSKEGLVDPWGAPYIYRSPGEHGKFDLSSLGSDGAAGGSGEAADISNWSPQN